MKKILTTVICAVWSQDKNRHALLHQHYENLNNQDANIDLIYVFENNDAPPLNLPGRKIVCDFPLTIYEAWNIALASCTTPFVMNLNLDDRLHKNAISTLEHSLIENDSYLVGGDWNILFEQDAVNSVSDCYDAYLLPFRPDWPPVAGSSTRLGSGTGERGTFGPATMWRMECHNNFPRYPYRTQLGNKIQSISDGIWWSIIINNLKLKTTRIPKVIGNYLSNPAGQAEFRHGDEMKMIINENLSLN